MDQHSKLFFRILLGAMVIATALAYTRYIVRHDYNVEGEPAPEESVDDVQSGGVTPSLSE